ncbi:MAG: thioredoxin family protein [Candidatus Marinimicrobia bacterium]|nr:thioredoxin family protein [Candidatus Neomarinimicrobiota bacterium]MDG1268548.1 thioredoxin family protein [Candidatus Neomarinimicrobiota bacterium]
MTKNKPFIEIEPKWSKRINIFILILAAISFGLFNLNSSDIPEGMFEDPKTGKPMLLGAIAIEELQQEPFAEWYQMESDGYEVDTELTNAISDPGQYTYEVFLGTWCGDSRREVPRMEKIFSEMGIDMSNVLIVTLDRDKISPNGEQEGKDIRYVPTLIVSKDNQEIGRIVESPSSETATLESDLFEISLGIPPVPNYSDTE